MSQYQSWPMSQTLDTLCQLYDLYARNKINMTSNKSVQTNFQIHEKQLCLSGHLCNSKNLLNPQH